MQTIGYDGGMQKQSIVSTAAIVSVGAAVVAALVWAWQASAAFISKGLSDSGSIRVSESNSCSPERADGPHFSGCNSIL